MPTSSDLVTDLPADFEVFGQAVATSMADLLGGTTGQILSKASNTNMDFTWTTPNPGDITAVTAGTGITGGGTSGDVTVSFDQANYGGGQFAAGKNKIINGNFGIWQRGTSGFTFGGGFNADRFQMYADGTGATRAITQQTFTPGTAPVSGYEGTYFFRYAQTVAGTGGTLTRFYQKVEDVRVFAGQTIALSFWAKADAARSITANLTQNFGSGGSSQVSTAFTGTASVTTSWQRFTFTVAAPSITGKTIGTSSYLEVDIDFPLNVVETIDIWGVQLEAGSTATPFQTASGTVQGELAICQRYYERNQVGATEYGMAQNYSSTQFVGSINCVVPKRTLPSVTVSTVGDFRVLNNVGTEITVTSLVSQLFSLVGCRVLGTVASGLVAGDATQLIGTSSAFLDWSAEL